MSKPLSWTSHVHVVKSTMQSQVLRCKRSGRSSVRTQVLLVCSPCSRRRRRLPGRTSSAVPSATTMPRLIWHRCGRAATHRWCRTGVPAAAGSVAAPISRAGAHHISSKQCLSACASFSAAGKRLDRYNGSQADDPTCEASAGQQPAGLHVSCRLHCCGAETVLAGTLLRTR